MKVLLIVPDGVAVRNYLYTSFISDLQRNKAKIIVYHQLSDSAISEIKNTHKGTLTFRKIPQFIESPLARLLRESIAYARLLRNKKLLNNKTILAFWSKKKGMKQRSLNVLSEIIGYFLSKSYYLILKADDFYEKNIVKNQNAKDIYKDIESLNPDVILNLHQRSPLSAPIITIAKNKKIKCATVIFSWDNVPKARLISRYDSYLVWSDLMKNQLTLLYPEIDKKDILVVGTPQFECYFDKELYLDKKTFFNQYNLDVNKQTVCFSANDRTSPYEPNYLEDVCESISKINERERPQILFRRCPVDKSDRFDKILEKYKSLVKPIDPDWRIDNEKDNSFTSIYPTYYDFVLLVNTVKHSDVVINLGSTMAHDFAVLDKPCLYLNYDPVINSTLPVKTIYNFEHFKSMKDLDPVGWINSKQEISKTISNALKNPEEVGVDRKKWMDKIVKHPLENNSQNIANTLL